MLLREEFEQREDALLAPYALRACRSRGRVYPEEKHQYRSDFQRDKERVTYTAAFRRLEYKTQVFSNFEGDHFRTRLTHTLEVALIARSMARSLRLNEDIVEAIALAHDLGHSPFGHAGESCLDTLMKGRGGFEHNIQSLRIVEELEDCYHAFPGINLTWEVREGLKKHATDRFRALEYGIVNIADEIAYNAHDLEDGLRARFILVEDVRNLGIWNTIVPQGDERELVDDAYRLKAIVTRNLVNMQVVDVIRTTEQAIVSKSIRTLDDVQAEKSDLVSFSPETAQMVRELKSFLFDRLYQHKYVKSRMADACRMITFLFTFYQKSPQEMPRFFTQKYLSAGRDDRVICDYIAGMTDRYALKEYERLKNFQAP